MLNDVAYRAWTILREEALKLGAFEEARAADPLIKALEDSLEPLV